MKIEGRRINGESVVVLSDVYSGIGSGIGIEADAGLFWITERNGGIEVKLNGESVWDWASHDAATYREALSPNGPGVRLPDGSGAFVASYPLPKDHWLYAEGRNEPPMPMRLGISPFRDQFAAQIRDAARYAIRASTMNGKETDFDPDAMVQNMVIGLLGYWTEDGLSHA